MIPDHYEGVVDGERGASGCGSARTIMVTRRTLRNDELDIWDEGMRKPKTTKNNLGECWIGFMARIELARWLCVRSSKCNF
jgi:hypothetical protein